VQVQDFKPDLSGWLQSNIISSLTEDGFAHAITHVANTSHVSVFTSLALAQHAGPTALSRLLLLLQRIASDRPPASASASSSMTLKSNQRRTLASDAAGAGDGAALSDDQAYLKAYCIVVALARFDHTRLHSPPSACSIVDCSCARV
jgi:hypothetical protein